MLYTVNLNLVPVLKITELKVDETRNKKNNLPRSFLYPNVSHVACVVSEETTDIPINVTQKPFTSIYINRLNCM